MKNFVPVLMITVGNAIGKRIIHRETNCHLVSERKNKDGSSWLTFRREKKNQDGKETISVHSKFVLGL